MAGFVKKLGEQVGSSVAGGIGSGIAGMGMSMLDEALFGNKRRKQQLEQQQKLTDMGTAQGMGMQKHAHDLNYDMWLKTNYGAQMEQLKAAGLNPAMIYGMGGDGGVTGTVGGGASSSGHASSESEQKQADIAQQGMGLQMQKTSAEIDVLKSQAEKNRADAGLSGSQSKTEEEKRAIFIENMRQAGMADWLDNLRKQVEHGGGLGDGEVRMDRNSVYNASTAFQKTSLWHEKQTTAIAESMAKAGSAEAQALLNNEKAKVVWEQLVNAQKIGDAVAMQAEAYKLANMWSTGEYTNWKTWADLGKDAVGLVFDGIKAIKSPPGTTIESMTKNINLPAK